LRAVVRHLLIVVKSALYPEGLGFISNVGPNLNNSCTTYRGAVGM